MKGDRTMIAMHERLHEYVIRNCISQKALALDTKVTQAKLSQLLNGKRRLTVEDYQRICCALHIDPRFFFEA